MLILAFETSAKAASAALLQDGLLLGETYQNDGQTHSRTVMKQAADLLENCARKPGDVDAVAYANGPGSFTGIRIGAAAAKGFCWGREIPCLPVSTLHGMARNLSFMQGVICACMDARRQQFYNALFSSDGTTLTRLCADRACDCQQLLSELEARGGPVLLVGDGAELCYEMGKDRIPGLRLAPEQLRQQRASGVALVGWEAAQRGEFTSAAGSLPNYLRLSQAERERLARDEN